MLKELSHFKNLGSTPYFLELLQQLDKSKTRWTTRDVRQYFFNRRIEGQDIFDGCLPLLEAIGVVYIDGNDSIVPDKQFLSYIKSEDYLSSKLLEWFLRKCENDDDFHNIFCSDNVSYDIIYGNIQISNSAFPFKYANVRQFLISLGFLKYHPDSYIRKLIIPQKYKKIFDFNILPEIRKRNIGVDELRKKLDRQRILGEQAEKFVLSYERRRLEDKKEPEWVSPYWTDAGYDIASYDAAESQDFDRLIEVKSYSGEPRFYWSRNEIDVARRKKGEYFLYLVDRKNMDVEGYVPLLIKNPYKVIFEDKKGWRKEADKYIITRERET